MRTVEGLRDGGDDGLAQQRARFQHLQNHAAQQRDQLQRRLRLQKTAQAHGQRA